jgi:ankyrin repeat protein
VINKALTTAAEACRSEAIQFLLKRGAVLTEGGAILRYISNRTGSVACAETAQWLLGRGVLPDTPTSDGQTALMMAAGNGMIQSAAYFCRPERT